MALLDQETIDRFEDLEKRVARLEALNSSQIEGGVTIQVPTEWVAEELEKDDG